MTNGEIGSVNAVTGTLALMAFVWVYGNAWADPLRATTNNMDAVAARGGQWWDAAHQALSTLGRRPDREALILAAQDPESDGPSPLQIKRARWGELSREAERYAAAGQHRDQVRVCSAWAQEDYNNPRAWRCLGLGHEALGEYKQAVEALQRSAKLDPKDSVTQEALIRSFRAQFKH